MSIELKVIWEKTTLGKHVDILTGFPFKSEKYSDNFEDVRLLRGDNVVQGKFRWDGVKRWSINELDTFSKYKLQVGDVILAMDRPWIEAGLKFAWISERDLPCLLVQRVARLRGSNGLITEYLRYIIADQSFTDYIKPIVTGINVPHISATQIQAYQFKLPPLSIQRKIAAILSAYDDLIENNTRRIQILEEMARMIYREWFVNFRFPEHESVKVVDSPLGMIPEGWQVVELGQFIDVKHGYAFKGENFIAEPTKDVLLTPGNFHIGGGFKDDKLKYYNGFVPDEYVLSEGELIVTMTDLSKLGDTLGYPAFVPPSKFQRFLHNQRLGRIVFVDKNIGKNFLYYVLCSDPYRHRMLATATGATVKHTAPERIKAFRITLPSWNIASKFESFVGAMRQQISCLSQKNQVLRQTRDLLLPKLISGQIDVADLDIPT